MMVRLFSSTMLCLMGAVDIAFLMSAFRDKKHLICGMWTMAFLQKLIILAKIILMR